MRDKRTPKDVYGEANLYVDCLQVSAQSAAVDFQLLSLPCHVFQCSKEYLSNVSYISSRQFKAFLIEKRS